MENKPEREVTSIFNLFLRLAIYYRGSRHSSVHELAVIIKEQGGNDVNRKRGEHERMAAVK